LKRTLFIFIVLIVFLSKHYAQIDSAYLVNYSNIISELIDNGEYEKALQKTDTLYDMAKSVAFIEGQAESYNLKGIIYRDRSNLKEALDNYLSSLKLFESLKRPIRVAGVQNNIGQIYSEIKEYRTALAYYFKAVAINKKYNRQDYLAINYNNMGTCYQHLKQYSSSQMYLNKSLKLRQTAKDTMGMAMAFHNIGINYQLNSQKDSAIFYFNKSLGYLGLYNQNIGHAYNYLELGNTYLQLNKLKEAESYLLKSLTICNKSEFEGLKVEIYNYLSKMYDKKNDFKNAYLYQNLYLESQQLVENDESKNEILKKELEYDFNTRQELQRKEAEKMRAISDAEIKAQKKLTLYAIIALVVLFGLIIIVFRSYNQKRKANFIISKQKEIVEHKQKEIVDSINYAKYIQNALLPSASAIQKLNINCFILFKPKDIVSGDFYWIHQTTNINNYNEIYLAAVDCTGHGVPGALVSVVGNNGLNRCVKEFNIHNTGKILDKLSELVEETFDKSENELKDGMDISLCSITKKEATDEIAVQWSGANNPLWILKKGTKEMLEIKANKQPVGKYINRTEFATHEIALNKGDKIYLFTDGYADQFGGEKGKKFKYKQLEELLITTQYLSLNEQKNKLDKALIDWKGNLEQVDDICIIGIEI
jgi:serine phosphatase RsbU (regulator of sigma subunit)